MRKIFVTGRPGIGKTSVVRESMQILKRAGFKPGGVFCPDMRVGGRRVGFELIDILTGSRGILAHVDQLTGPQVSRYRVNLRDLREVGAGAILRAIEGADFIVIDEVGPMELYSEEFRRAVLEALDSPKPVLGVIHWRARHPLVDLIRSRRDVRIYEVTFENRDKLGREIADELLAELKQ